MRSINHGFSLIEILVVISILAVLASMSMAAIGSIRETSRSMLCQGNMRQFGLAFSTYTTDNKGRWPTGNWNNLLDEYVDDGNMASGQAARIVNCPAQGASTYGYTGVYYNSIVADGETTANKYKQYPFTWVWWLFIPVVINDSQIINRGQKVVLSERMGAWGDNTLNDRGGRRMHGAGGNFLCADLHVQSLAMPGVKKYDYSGTTIPNFKNDPMFRPRNTAISAFIK